jgi:hypothetical protein
MPSNLGRSQFLECGFLRGKKIRREFKTRLKFAAGKNCMKCSSYIQSDMVLMYVASVIVSAVLHVAQKGENGVT